MTPRDGQDGSANRASEARQSARGPGDTATEFLFVARHPLSLRARELEAALALGRRLELACRVLVVLEDAARAAVQVALERERRNLRSAPATQLAAAWADVHRVLSASGRESIPVVVERATSLACAVQAQMRRRSYRLVVAPSCLIGAPTLDSLCCSSLGSADADAAPLVFVEAGRDVSEIGRDRA